MHMNDTDDCFAVRQAARHLSQLYERHLSGAGITPTQFSILGALDNRGSLTMLQLARELVMDRTTLVRTLRPLMRSELIADEAGIVEKRRLQLVLTSGGRAKLDEARVYWKVAQDEFERKFGKREAADLRSELFRVTRDVAKV